MLNGIAIWVVFPSLFPIPSPLTSSGHKVISICCKLKILKDSDKEKESEQQRTRQEFLSSQAYTLFSATTYSQSGGSICYYYW
ncbi:MAG TPA: hypothetical protein VFI70_01310 [Nitrososphaeraceae archaeon]|nr:hypothetical protein [Nitrososphaeraceae archaeon]